MTQRRNLLDRLELYEWVLHGAADDDVIPLRAWQLRNLIAELRRYYRPGRGQPPRTGRMLAQDRLLVARAKRRKQELVAGGLSATEAEKQACKEIAKSDKRPRGLSDSAIQDRVQHPQRYRARSR
jgi:hypothetical protein